MLHFLIRARGPARCMQWLGSVCCENAAAAGGGREPTNSMAGVRAARKGSEIRRRCYCCESELGLQEAKKLGRAQAGCTRPADVLCFDTEHDYTGH